MCKTGSIIPKLLVLVLQRNRGTEATTTSDIHLSFLCYFVLWLLCLLPDTPSGCRQRGLMSSPTLDDICGHETSTAVVLGTKFSSLIFRIHIFPSFVPWEVVAACGRVRHTAEITVGIVPLFKLPKHFQLIEIRSRKLRIDAILLARQLAMCTSVNLFRAHYPFLDTINCDGLQEAPNK